MPPYVHPGRVFRFVGADDLGAPLYDPLPRQNGRFVNRPYEQTPIFAVGADIIRPRRTH